jgi:hypothetical protein
MSHVVPRQALLHKSPVMGPRCSKLDRGRVQPRAGTIHLWRVVALARIRHQSTAHTSISTASLANPYEPTESKAESLASM